MKLLRSIDLKTVLVELVIVFVGLFAALQVDEWRQDRELRESLNLQLARLEQDLDETVERLAGTDGEGGVRAFVRRNRDDVQQVSRSLEAGRILNADTASVARGLIYFGHLPSVPLSDAAFRELLASGLFSRIEDEALKAAVSRLYADAERTERNFTWWRRNALELEPWVNARVRYREGDQGDAYSRGAHRVEFDFADLVGDRQLINGFYWAYDTHSDWLGQLDDLHAQAVEARLLLRNYLNASS